MKDIIFLVGPTAVGKTKTSLYLAKAINGEIISCDSMQIYRSMDIGTQKPTPSQLKKIIHHMIDVVSPLHKFSVAEFRDRALKAISAIHAKDKIPIFVGGTALYMKALVDGLFPSPRADRPLRKKLGNEEKIHGSGFLYKKLLRVDKDTARLLHPNDTRRIVRALEVYTQTKVPMSKLKKKTKGLKGSYNIKIFCLNRNRDKLYENINKRVDKMFRDGLVSECRQLKKKRLSMTAKKALGYREVFDYIDGNIKLRDAKEQIKKNTRNFAKRQLSWFRNDKRIEWIDCGNGKPQEVAKILKGLILVACKEPGIQNPASGI